MNFKRKKQRTSNKWVSCSYCVPSIGLDREQMRIAEEQIRETLSETKLAINADYEYMDVVASNFDVGSNHEHPQ